MNEQNFLVILSGLPASGKSVFAKALKDTLLDKYHIENVKIVDPDIIREDIMNSGFDHEKEKLVRSRNLTRIRNFLAKGFIVISDDLNYYTSMRHDLKQISDDLQIPHFLIYIATPLRKCIEWNSRRGKPISNSLIHQISQRFDTFDNYQWETPFRKYDMSKVEDLQEEIKKLVHSFMDYLEKEKINPLTKKSLLLRNEKNQNKRRLDIITREIVGNLIKTIQDATFKKKILKYRKRFMKIHLDDNLNENEIKRQFQAFLEQHLDDTFS